MVMIPAPTPHKEKVIRKTLLSPDQFQFTAKHPEHEHVDQQMPDAAMKEKIGDGLPDTQAGDWTKRNKTKLMVDPGCRVGGDEDRGEGLQQKNASTGQNNIFNGWSDEAAPIEANFRRAERRTHRVSVRRGEAARQKVRD